MVLDCSELEWSFAQFKVVCGGATINNSVHSPPTCIKIRTHSKRSHVSLVLFGPYVVLTSLNHKRLARLEDLRSWSFPEVPSLERKVFCMSWGISGSHFVLHKVSEPVLTKGRRLIQRRTLNEFLCSMNGEFSLGTLWLRTTPSRKGSLAIRAPKVFMTSYNGSNESYEYRVTYQIFIKC